MRVRGFMGHGRVVAYTLAANVYAAGRLKIAYFFIVMRIFASMLSRASAPQSGHPSVELSTQDTAFVDETRPTRCHQRPRTDSGRKRIREKVAGARGPSLDQGEAGVFLEVTRATPPSSARRATSRSVVGPARHTALQGPVPHAIAANARGLRDARGGSPRYFGWNEGTRHRVRSPLLARSHPPVTRECCGAPSPAARPRASTWLSRRAGTRASANDPRQERISLTLARSQLAPALTAPAHCGRRSAERRPSACTGRER